MRGFYKGKWHHDETAKEDMRLNIRKSLGLNPMPEPTPEDRKNWHPLKQAIYECDEEEARLKAKTESEYKERKALTLAEERKREEDSLNNPLDEEDNRLYHSGNVTGLLGVTGAKVEWSSQ